MNAPIRDVTDEDFVRALLSIPCPVMAFREERTHTVPDDRSEFTRDSESTGA